MKQWQNGYAPVFKTVLFEFDPRLLHMEHHTHSKGDIGVAKVAADLLSRDIRVFTPMSAVIPFDLVCHHKGYFYRIEVKYRTITDGTIAVRPLRNTGNKKKKLNTEFDILAIYVPEVDRCYYLRKEQISGTGIKLRFEPAKNNQVKKILQAEDYCKFPL